MIFYVIPKKSYVIPYTFIPTPRVFKTREYLIFLEQAHSSTDFRCCRRQKSWPPENDMIRQPMATEKHQNDVYRLPILFVCPKRSTMHFWQKIASLQTEYKAIKRAIFYLKRAVELWVMTWYMFRYGVLQKKIMQKFAKTL